MGFAIKYVEPTRSEWVARIATLERQRDAWQETAKQHCRNEQFYHELLDDIGKLFGDAAKRQDDGGLCEDVLVLRVHECVYTALAELAAAQAKIASDATFIQQLGAACVEAETEAIALKDDAERYRVLKPLLDSADFAYGDPPRSVIVFAWNRPVSANLDAMLDAAIDVARLPSAPTE